MNRYNMTAASASGTGPGAADQNLPPNIKLDRLVGNFDPRILASGRATMSGGSVVITHNFINLSTPNIARIAISNSAYPVWVASYTDTSFSVDSTQLVSTFGFTWMIIETGTSTNLPE